MLLQGNYKVGRVLGALCCVSDMYVRIVEDSGLNSIKVNGSIKYNTRNNKNNAKFIPLLERRCHFVTNI